MEKNNSKIWVWIIVVAVVVIAGVLIYVFDNNQSATATPTDATTSAADTSAAMPDSTEDLSGETGTGSVSIAYADALVQYAGRRIQLDSTCEAFPDMVTYKGNTGIMIDNRSAFTRTIKLGTTFTIKPWGFKIIILPNLYLTEKTLLMDCDQSQNVATVLIQE